MEVNNIEAVLDYQSRALRGDLVRQRIIAGLSRKDVANRMGIKPRDVEAIEEGKTDLYMSTLRRYCLAVDALVEWQVVEYQAEPEPWSVPAPAVPGETDAPDANTNDPEGQQ